MASPGPKLPNALNQIMDVSNRLGLFQPNNPQPMVDLGVPTLNSSNASTFWQTAPTVPANAQAPKPVDPTATMQIGQRVDTNSATKDNLITQTHAVNHNSPDWNKISGYAMGGLSLVDHLIQPDKIKAPVIRPLQSYNPHPYGTGSQAIAKDGIHINPAHKGLFTSEAKAHHEGVQEFARQVLSHKDNYSSAVVKRANFAKNFGGKKAEFGSVIDDQNPGPKTPKKPFSFVDEFKSLHSYKLDGQDSFQLAKKAAKAANVDPSLLYSSAYVEGMNQNLVDPRPMQSKAYENAMQGYYTDYSGKKRLGTQNKVDPNLYPVDGYSTYGLDTFGGRFDEFVKKGYLPASFKDQFVPYTATNESKEQVKSAAFKNNEAALQAKAAYLRAQEDYVTDYFKKRGQQIDPEALNFFTMATYNSTTKSGNGIMDEYMQAPDKKAFIEQGKTKYKSIWNHVQPRMQLMPLVNEHLNQPMKNGGKMKYNDGGMLPYYQEGNSYDVDHNTIKQLLDAGYELDFE